MAGPEAEAKSRTKPIDDSRRVARTHVGPSNDSGKL